MIYIISCRNLFEKDREIKNAGSEESGSHWGLVLEVVAHLTHLVHFLGELKRLHGKLVQCSQFVVLAASAEGSLDVFQLVFIA
jgi:hypothetical protein